MPRTAPLCLLLIGLLAGGGVRAQPAALTGRVTDAAGGGLPGAHVYLAGTTLGTATDAEGRYRLAPLPLGAHRVVASMVGYVTAAEDVVLREGGGREVSFRLAEDVRALGEVSVEARADRRWQRRFARFERAFFGQSTFARELTLRNPEVLSFSERWGSLRAEAAAPLLIENRALGYLLRYDLEVFEADPFVVRYDGDSFFEELEPADEAEAARWAANRATAYAGSLPHLLRSMLAGTTEAEGFVLIHRPDEGPRRRAMALPATGLPPLRRVVRPEDVLRPAEHAGEALLAFRGLLEVHYAGAPEDPGYLTWEWNRDRLAHPRPDQRSELLLERGPALIDASGEPADPFAITRRGYLAFRRVAMLLPAEYGRGGEAAPTP